MRLLVHNTFCRVGGVAKFQATDGVEPYSYSIQSGGGHIDSSSGLYTAPMEAPSDPRDSVVTVRAEDSDGSFEDKEFMILTVEELVAQIIKDELSLASDQVLIQNQKFKLPNDGKLYCSVLIVDGNPFYNNKKRVSDNTGLMEVQSIGHRSMLSVNIMSATLEAKNRRHELMMALQSSYSEQIQDAYGFKIAKTPLNVTSLSNIDGSRIPFAFNITVPIQYAEKRIKYIEYYDKFEIAKVELIEP